MSVAFLWAAPAPLVLAPTVGLHSPGGTPCGAGAEPRGTLVPVPFESTQPVVPGDRVHLVPGSHNVRDLGGLRTRSGRTVRTGRVYRSDYPSFLEVDATAIARFGLATVVDLRRGTEAAEECIDWGGRGVAYRRWPLTAGRESSWHARYTSYLTRRPETVVGAVREVMRPAAHTVLFHCAAGKDRTGVLAALLLAVLGVGEDDIVADYLLSAASVEPVIARLVEMEMYAGMLADSSVDEQLPRAEHMHLLLRWLERHGGAEAWLVEHGVPAGELTDFRDVMLER
nr:tyrosine-protein phosphatase [Nocardioides humi]